MESELIKQLTVERKRLSGLIDAIDTLLRVYEGESTITKPTDSTKYNFDEDNFNLLFISEAKSIPEKILYVLKILNVATASQVADKLIELDSSFTPKKAKRDATVHLSRLFRTKAIEANTRGLSYTYKYIPQRKSLEI